MINESYHFQKVVHCALHTKCTVILKQDLAIWMKREGPSCPGGGASPGDIITGQLWLGPDYSIILWQGFANKQAAVTDLSISWCCHPALVQ